MTPALTLLRSVTRDESACLWCGWILRELDVAYAVMVGDVEMRRFCSHRCSAEHARFTKAGPLRVSYAR